VCLPCNQGSPSSRNRSTIAFARSKSPTALKIAVADARSYINREYPPGGAIGYFRWMFTNGRFEKGVFEGVKAEMSLSQRGWTWLIRVVLSLLFMSCGVASQTLLLADHSQTVPPLGGRPILRS